MNADTRKALIGSIAKWQAIVDGTGEDKGADNCPLCRRFDDEERYTDDEGRRRYRSCVTERGERCPVTLKTGMVSCEGSPYVQWTRLYHSFECGGPYVANTPERLAAAQAELAFLQSLLPKD